MLRSLASRGETEISAGLGLIGIGPCQNKKIDQIHNL